MAHGAGAFGRRVPRDDLLPRLPDRRVPAADAGSPTLASRVAEMLGVSRASAGEMLKRLEADGLVERGEHKEAILTPTGRERAEQVVRKHRIDRAAADRLHGLHGRRGARPRRRARRHASATTWSSGSTRSSAIPTAARTAGRSTPTSSRPRTASSSPLADLEPGTRGRDRPPRRARRRPAALVLRPGLRARARGRGARGAAGGRAAHGARSTATSRRSPRRPPPGLFVRPAA